MWGFLFVVGYCSDVLRAFSMAEPSKGPKKANNRLNSTWNTTRCKVASFFLFSLRLLPKVFRILPVNVIRMVTELNIFTALRGAQVQDNNKQDNNEPKKI